VAAPLATTGNGAVDVGASAAAELAASATSISLGASHGQVWRVTRTFTIRNVSTRRLVVRLAPVVPAQAAKAVRLTVKPKRVALRVGQQRRITVSMRASRPRLDRTLTGVVRITPVGSQTLRVPWAIVLPRPGVSLVPRAWIEPATFKPSDTSFAILRVRAGRVLVAGGVQILPVERLDVLLYRSNGRFVGRLARQRDLLPGTYAFGITGRGPEGAKLPRGAYELRLVAWPVLGGKPSRTRVRFGIE
jgi:hypothetical protein